MTCPALHTGSSFLSTTLEHLDCQARNIGAYGYGALADPSSGITALMTALLTIFIALFGIRLMLGQEMGVRDVVADVLKIGIVLTLATSWPAFRVLAYDSVITGPGQIARTMGLAAGLPTGDQDLIARLQNADDGLVAITAFGTGRLTGGVLGSSDLRSSFNGVALADQAGFGWGRVAFLTGVIGPYAVTRVGAGLLLGVAPIMAGLFLFAGTLPVFVGWVRGLVFVTLASLALSIGAGVELSLLTPWLSDVLSVRSSNVFTPAAPTELMVLASAFSIMILGLTVLCARVAFQPYSAWNLLQSDNRNAGGSDVSQRGGSLSPASGSQDAAFAQNSRAQAVADSVAGALRREEAGGMAAQHRLGAAMLDRHIDLSRSPSAGNPSQSEALGSSFRRTNRRTSQAGARRDKRA